MTTAPAKKKRCTWSGTDPLYVAYHDNEWGVPVHDDRVLLEFLVLEGAQAGLSWTTIRKRDAYRRDFDQFDPGKIARYDKRKVGALLADAGIVRKRAKIESAIKNAKAFLDVQAEFGSFDAYQWRFVDGRPVQSRRQTAGEGPRSQRPIRGYEQGSEETRLHLRVDDGLRAHAGRRHGQ